jgi:4-alpha-glucanotransferase
MDVSALLNSASKERWQRVGLKKRAGVLIPLFAVFSAQTIAVADFSDLKLLIDWLVKTGNSILQLLPMNETGTLHCPYDAISSFALEPLYLSLGQMPLSRVLRKKTAELKIQFPAGGAYVDYGFKVAKLKLLQEIFQGQKLPPAFEQFVQENRYWLDDFALFRVLKDYHQGLPWYEWAGQFRDREAPALAGFQRDHQQEIIFQQWLQWQTYLQFRTVKEYASRRKIILKGDLPILVSRDSADVWAHRDFFKLEFAAGAPPDMYAALGQRWGMPTYNWENIACDDYRYLKQRLRYAENFYDILRIDHVVGLFRIWSIPYDQPQETQGLNGFFDPADQSRWGEHGKTILSVMLASTKMLLCAEDLGVIPPVCAQLLGELGIPGNDVQRWTKDWKIKHDFLAAQDYRLSSVAVLSTHDTTNWQAWWENECGTVDEALFMRKCAGRVDYLGAKAKLFEPLLSAHGRLRWLNSLDSVDKLIEGLSPQRAVPKGHLLDFIDLYENSFQEKEKLWKQMKLAGPMREKSDREILAAALRIALEASSIFSIQLVTDWLALAPDILSHDPYNYRVNTPGTISPRNWSQVFPISIEKLLRHPLCAQIKQMIVSSGRG